MNTSLPVLVTFDGQARSGKGTIVHAVKRSLLSEDIKTMLIDAGQVFRVLVVSATQHGVNCDSPDEIDQFLSDKTMLVEAASLIKSIYKMSHEERDALLYTLEIGVTSAKVGARPLSQEFKDELLKKWLYDAHEEGYRVILLDGRALEEVGLMLEDDNLCDYKIGFYFTCDPVMGARRTLGLAGRAYEQLSDSEKTQVDELTTQIIARNKADTDRKVQPIIPPQDAVRYALPEFSSRTSGLSREMFVVDTSAEMTKEQMVSPIVSFLEHFFHGKVRY